MLVASQTPLVIICTSFIVNASFKCFREIITTLEIWLTEGSYLTAALQLAAEKQAGFGLAQCGVDVSEMLSPSQCGQHYVSERSSAWIFWGALYCTDCTASVFDSSAIVSPSAGRVTASLHTMTDREHKKVLQIGTSTIKGIQEGLDGLPLIKQKWSSDAGEDADREESSHLTPSVPVCSVEVNLVSFYCEHFYLQ